jgi:hypothetical protein
MRTPQTKGKRKTRRVLPAIGLFFLAPLIGEALARELPHRFGPLDRSVPRGALRGTRGGAARRLWLADYHRLRPCKTRVLEEGVATQSLFDPNDAGRYHLLTYGFRYSVRPSHAGTAISAVANRWYQQQSCARPRSRSIMILILPLLSRSR